MMKPDASRNTSIERVYLEKIALSAATSVSPELLIMKPRIEVFEDVVGHMVTVQMRGFFWGRTLERHEIEYPLDWWQAFKKRWFPGWALRWWPVVSRTEEISLTAYWPSLSIEVPDHEPRLVLTKNGASIGGFGGEG